MRIRESVAIVTGASRGIGRATSLALGREGARLVLAARTGAHLDQLADEIGRSGGEAIAVPTDVSKGSDVERLVGRTLDRWGAPDILVTSVGEYLRRPIVTLAPEDQPTALVALEAPVGVEPFYHRFGFERMRPNTRRHAGAHAHIELVDLGMWLTTPQRNEIRATLASLSVTHAEGILAPL